MGGGGARAAPDQRNGYRPVDLATVRPSRDLSLLANEFEPTLPGAFRFLSRGLGTRQTSRPDALSTIVFQPDYIRELIDVGEEDARSQLPGLETVLGPAAAPTNGAGLRG